MNERYNLEQGNSPEITRVPANCLIGEGVLKELEEDYQEVRYSLTASETIAESFGDKAVAASIAKYLKKLSNGASIPYTRYETFEPDISLHISKETDPFGGIEKIFNVEHASFGLHLYNPQTQKALFYGFGKEVDGSSARFEHAFAFVADYGQLSQEVTVLVSLGDDLEPLERELKPLLDRE